MANKYQYVVVRYVPNVVRDEAVNVGVLVRGSEGVPFEYRFLPRSATVKKLWPDRDAYIVRQLERQVRRAKEGDTAIGELGKVTDPDFFERAMSEFNGNLQFTQPRGILAERAADALHKTYRQFVAEPEEQRPISYQNLAPYKTRERLWTAFERSDLIAPGKLVKQFRVDGKHVPWTFDLGYVNGGVNLICSVALDSGLGDTNLGRALVLKGMVDDVRGSHSNFSGATAVYRVPSQDDKAPAASEARKILADSGIETLSFHELPELVKVVASHFGDTMS